MTYLPTISLMKFITDPARNTEKLTPAMNNIKIFKDNKQGLLSFLIIKIFMALVAFILIYLFSTS